MLPEPLLSEPLLSAPPSDEPLPPSEDESFSLSFWFSLSSGVPPPVVMVPTPPADVPLPEEVPLLEDMPPPPSASFLQVRRKIAKLYRSHIVGLSCG